MDPLADVLAIAGVRSMLGNRIEAGENWGFDNCGRGTAAFYAVTAGTAWFSVPGQSPRRLMPGDVLLLPTGIAHTLSSEPGVASVRCDRTSAEHPTASGTVLRFGSGEIRTQIVAASYEYDPTVSTQVLTLLPEIVHVKADHGAGSLDDTVRLLSRELAHPQLAGAVVLNRLVDILLVQLLRVWLREHPADARGSWLGVLGDPLVSAAMTKLHQDPARPWTTEILAAELAISRTTLARRFRTVAGETPGGYLTRWRMDLAAVRLRDTDDTLDAIARSVGYTSVYAFSRAFRRAREHAPGRYRSASRAAAPV